MRADDEQIAAIDIGNGVGAVTEHFGRFDVGACLSIYKVRYRPVGLISAALIF